jgi:hypothetical protein
MPSTPADADARPTSAEWNERIRLLVAETAEWTPDALAALGELRDGWRRAVAREAALAA